jgi:hypothetical protein
VTSRPARRVAPEVTLQGYGFVAKARERIAVAGDTEVAESRARARDVTDTLRELSHQYVVVHAVDEFNQRQRRRVQKLY